MSNARARSAQCNSAGCNGNEYFSPLQPPDPLFPSRAGAKRCERNSARPPLIGRKRVYNYAASINHAGRPEHAPCAYSPRGGRPPGPFKLFHFNFSPAPVADVMNLFFRAAGLSRALERALFAISPGLCIDVNWMRGGGAVPSGAARGEVVWICGIIGFSG